MSDIVKHLSGELERIEDERPDELDGLHSADDRLMAWASASSAFASFSSVLLTLSEMAAEKKGGARTMAEVAARESRRTAAALAECLPAGASAAVMLKAAKAYDEVKTYHDLSRVIDAHLGWARRMGQWVADELPWDEVSGALADAWSGGKGGKADDGKAKGKAKGKKARKAELAREARKAAKDAKKAKRAEKGKKAKKKPRKGNKGKK